MKRLPGLAVVLAACLLALACSASGDGAPDGGAQPAPGGSPPVEEPLVIYTDTLDGAIVASTPDGAHRWRKQVDPTKELIRAVDCTADGARSLTLKSEAQTSQAVITIADQSGVRDVRLDMRVFGADWSPDGSSIAVTGTGLSDLNNFVGLIDPDTGELSRLVSGTGTIGPPTWSPDGRKLAFDSGVGRGNEIFVYALGSAAPVQVTAGGGQSFSPDWTPDGGALVFSRFLEGGGIAQLFRLPISDVPAGPQAGEAEQLTTSDVAKIYPRWSPDAKHLAYVGTVWAPQLSLRPSAALHNVAVWLADPQLTNERPLTDLSIDAWLLGWCRPGPWLDATWTADG